MDLSIIPTAYAATATGAAPHQEASGMYSILLLVGFVLIFYFLLWRPQSKRAKEHRDLIGKLNKGDEVVTNGGIIGKINKITDDFVLLAIADNVEITVQKPAISGSLPKGTLKSV